MTFETSQIRRLMENKGGMLLKYKTRLLLVAKIIGQCTCSKILGGQKFQNRTKTVRARTFGNVDLTLHGWVEMCGIDRKGSMRIDNGN